MSFLAQQLLWGAVLPATITFGMLVVGWRAWKREGVPMHWSTPLALVFGYLFAHWRIVGVPTTFPPSDSTQWLFATAVISMVWALVENFSRLSTAARMVGRAVLVATILWLALKPLMDTVWKGSTGTWWWTGLALSWWIWWNLQAYLTDKVSGLTTALVLSMVAGIGGFVLLWSNTSSLSQLSGAVAAITGAVVPLALWRRNARLDRGGMAVVAGVLGLLWVNAIAFVPVPAGRIVVMALASLSPLIALVPALRNKHPWTVTAICAAITVGILIALTVPIYLAYTADQTSLGY